MLMRPGAIMVSDQPMTAEGLIAIPLPEHVTPGRYFFSQAI
jgi:hypothetical protein